MATTTPFPLIPDSPPTPADSSISSSSAPTPTSLSAMFIGFAACFFILTALVFMAVPSLALLPPGVITEGPSSSSSSSSSGGLAGGAISNSSLAPVVFPHRKLLIGRSLGNKEVNRMWGDKCTTGDIVISQGPTSPLPSGIPTYTVEIMNVCVTGCDIGRIHITCGWFSSARLINPKVFKRLRYNDCLVNDGKPLVNGGTLSFEYANTYSYPLAVSSVVCR